jgi:PKHD-type hydroxylase
VSLPEGSSTFGFVRAPIVRRTVVSNAVLTRDARALSALEAEAPAPAVAYPDVLSPEECALVYEAVSDQQPLSAGVGLTNLQDSEFRRAGLRWLAPDAETAWVYDRLASYVELANSTVFGFDLVGFEGPLQYTEYGPGGLFEWHQDIGPGRVPQRKLSAVCILSRPDEHDGGQLEFPDGLLTHVPGLTELLLEPPQGTLVLFPSYQLHRVTPVTRGVRRSLVAWIVGPPLR